jgi:hypothetical protein
LPRQSGSNGGLKKMIPGFNHNVMHNGKMYHIQTEDSGLTNPHIITHLFIGGNIVASRKTSYADIVKSDKLEEVVREIMEEQHKGMLRDLKANKFDQPQEATADEAPEPPPPAQEKKEEPAEVLDLDANSDKTLDEVILDYLAHDLDGTND